MHGLDWYDYGARYYDAVLGRWMCVDPLAEKYPNVYSYCFTLNNPIRFIDEYGIEVGYPPNRRSSLLDKRTYWVGNVLKGFVGGIGGDIIGLLGGL